jgi:hypothetical protein
MGTWEELKDELDAWGARGRPATFWWRDDDAMRATPALETLLLLGRRTATPLAVAVIPEPAEPGLYERLQRAGDVAVLQHGYAHRNHAPAGAKKAEFGPHRPLAAMLAELSDGWRRINLSGRALPALVPPWNRIDPRLVAVLPEAGLSGLSLHAPRRGAEAAAGVRQSNVHVDLIDWRGGRGFVGEGPALALVLAHLRARRRGDADAAEATGLLTHHRVHDRACWSFLGRLLDFLHGHPAARWVGAGELFPLRTSERCPATSTQDA